jgi:hypothetical protein
MNLTEYIKYIGEFVDGNMTICAWCMLIIGVISEMSAKRNRTFLLTWLFILLMYFMSFCFEIVLYHRKIIDFWILLGEFILALAGVFSRILTSSLSRNYSLYLPLILSQLIISFSSLSLSIYIVYYLNFFDDKPLLRYLFWFVFLLSGFVEYKRYRIRRDFFNEFEDKSEAYAIIKQNLGTTGTTFPTTILLWNNVLLVFTLLSVLSKVQSSKTNVGIFHSMNRVCHVTDGVDKYWRTYLYLILGTIFLSNGYNVNSFAYVFLVIGFWPLVRSSGDDLSKYYTVFVGERRGHRPKLYDNLLDRVLPDQSLGFWSRSKVGKSVIKYSLFFHNHRFLYDDTMGVKKSSQIVKRANHLVVIFHETTELTNFICEKDLVICLQSPVIIIDTWKSTFNSKALIGLANEEFLFGKITGDCNWLEMRLSILQRISDESFGDVGESYSEDYQKSDDLKRQAQQVNMRQAIVNSSSFESLRQNIQLFEHLYKETDHERVKQLTGRGIYELNTLFRQLHESPSIPSRFIDLLNVAECMIRYLVGFLHAERVGDGKVLHGNLLFDTKAIAFGSCTDFLARWKKSDAAGETILGSRISALLDVVYDDIENVEALVKYIRIMNPGVTAKYSQKPTLHELSWWMVTVRNKTRGHGTPSKVDYGFYVCLEKVVLFMLAECSKLELSPCFIAEVDGQKWTFHLSSGGYPEPVPVVDELQKGVHFNPLLEDEMIERLTANHRCIVSHIPAGDESLYLYVTDGEQTEWWRCHKHFQLKDAIVHLLNQRDDKKESWISFSTGRIMRPEISEI